MLKIYVLLVCTLFYNDALATDDEIQLKIICNHDPDGYDFV